MGCIFCGREFTTDNYRTSEHVLRRSWIEALEHDKTPMPGELRRDGSLVEKRGGGALSVVTGGVCKRCNNGWMERVDDQVSASILGLARGEIGLDALGPEQRFALSRWLVKTTCAFRFGSADDFRHIPVELMRHVERDDFIPRGFISFAFQEPTEVKALRVSSLAERFVFDMDSAESKELPQAQRPRAAFQYDRLIIGCAWTESVGLPLYRLVPGLHTLLYEHGAVHIEAFGPDLENIATGLAKYGHVITQIQMGLTFDTIPMFPLGGLIER
jgi:hypothetical protein